MKYLSLDGVKYLWSKTKEAYLPSNNISPAFRNSIYRGKYLGTDPTDAQLKAIASDSFDDLYVGDYWQTDTQVYRIAAFDYFWNVGYDAFQTPHIVIVPDRPFYEEAMNASDTTDTGYQGSAMFNDVAYNADAIITDKFEKEHVAIHSVYLVNKASNGIATGGAWYDRRSELLTEMMVFGNKNSGSQEGEFNPYNFEELNLQLPLFKLAPWCIYQTRSNWWLRDIATSDSFMSVYAHGGRDARKASSKLGVRPYFCLI